MPRRIARTCHTEAPSSFCLIGPANPQSLSALSTSVSPHAQTAAGSTVALWEMSALSPKRNSSAPRNHRSRGESGFRVLASQRRPGPGSWPV